MRYLLKALSNSNRSVLCYNEISLYALNVQNLALVQGAQAMNN